MRTIAIAAITAISIALTGCVSVTVPQKKPQVAPLSITSSPLHRFSLSDFDGLIFEPIIPEESDPMFPNRENVYQKLEGTIAQQLSDRMKIDPDQLPQAPLIVRYGIASDTTVSDAELVRFFGTTPGLVTEPGQEKLTIAIALVRANTGDPLWKGVAQGTIVSGLTSEMRMARAEAAVARMLSSLK
ncbi:DUF4136 domain-containing protein [Endozoicomonas arenosclerae]|uniref:DUF4136 domain-containing protein n=1 Tax=Endozoicomonas arenosclerae TaxID=1633495 RepID=UPI00078415D3|nr:DUF4136 domain-containing protein [Endozoicomonas arenosclerae]